MGIGGPARPPPRRLRELFEQARALSGSHRAAFLDSACGDDGELRNEVEALLAIDASDSAPRLTQDLDRLVGAAARGAFEPVPAEIPQRIGRYRILRRIGEGGMGTVFEAAQDSPRRTVALKIMHGGTLSPELVRRFRHEAQILAHLQYPGIAQIHEAGWFETSLGSQPYFAMELVRGDTVIEYTERRGLDTEDRLRLLMRICAALEHAHQKGVIHRDIKPGNILVDDAGQPKILDFGVARAVADDLELGTLHTGIGHLVGTLQYMSPEQAKGSPGATDTRSDVYSLGVVAYELLTGELPYAVKGLPLTEAVRLVREGTDAFPGSHGRGLRGDLRSILLQALQRDPVRRYQSASELAADPRRHLNHEPVAARSASLLYVLGKLARRHTAWFVGTGAVMLVVVVSLAATSRLYVRSEQARVEKQREAERATAVYEFLVEDMLGAADPQRDGYEVRVLEVLERAEKSVGSRFEGEPMLEAEVRDALGRTLFSLGRHRQALEQRRRAARVFATELGADDERSLEAQTRVGISLKWTGEHEASERILRDVHERARTRLGPRHPVTARAAVALGEILQIHGKAAEAETLLRLGLEVFDDGSQTPRDWLGAASSLVALLISQQRYSSALDLARHAVAASEEVHGATSYDTLVLQMNLVSALRMEGHQEEASRLALKMLPAMEEVFPAEHPIHGMFELNCALALNGANRVEEALEHARVAYERIHSLHGPNRFETEQAVTALVTISRRNGDAAALRRWAEHALELRCRIAGPGELPSVLRVMQQLEELIASANANEDIGAAFLSLAADWTPEGDPRRARVFGNRGRGFLAMGRLDSPYTMLWVAYTSLESSDQAGEDRPTIVGALVELHERRGERAEADGWRARMEE